MRKPVGCGGELFEEGQDRGWAEEKGASGSSRARRPEVIGAWQSGKHGSAGTRARRHHRCCSREANITHAPAPTLGLGQLGQAIGAQQGVDERRGVVGSRQLRQRQQRQRRQRAKQQLAAPRAPLMRPLLLLSLLLGLLRRLQGLLLLLLLPLHRRRVRRRSIAAAACCRSAASDRCSLEGVASQPGGRLHCC